MQKVKSFSQTVDHDLHDHLESVDENAGPSCMVRCKGKRPPEMVCWDLFTAAIVGKEKTRSYRETIDYNQSYPRSDAPLAVNLSARDK